MKNAIKILGIIALAATIGFSMTACDSGGGGGGSDSGITITVTGIPEGYIGKWGELTLFPDGGGQALTALRNNEAILIPSSTSVIFTLLHFSVDGSDRRRFNESGTYWIMLDFYENKNATGMISYYAVTRAITEGANTIPFTEF
jgi:hypothetical protein